jgi:penicillin-binding protein 1C
MIYALKLELHLNKREILEIYLNRTPYGNQNYGVEAAARFYFGRPSSALSLGESCVLAVVPKSPTRLNPRMNPGRIRKEKERLLLALLEENLVDSLSFFCAMEEPLYVAPKVAGFEAPHFVDYVLEKMAEAGAGNPSRVTTTLDLDLQKDFERLVSTSLNELKGYSVNQASVLVMDTQTGEILAMVGSENYFDEKEGQVNGCLALRQPGSSIKPFVYILALGSGIPISQVLPDTSLEFRLWDGTRFAPRNYGDRFHGPTRAREALASSFNVPTVYLLEKLGVERFHALLRELGFIGLDEETSHYGLSLGLGAGEVTLLEMVNAYRSIALGGTWKKEKAILYPEPGLSAGRESRRVFSREAACIITDVLSDNASRIKAFGEDSPLNLPFPCASKTGTSKDFRDNWCMGFTRRYVVGVWVGNFDGSPMQGVSGISGAAPLFRDIMIELHRDSYPGDLHESVPLMHLRICGVTGRVAGQGCPNEIEEMFIPGTEPTDTCTCSVAPPSESDLQLSAEGEGKRFRIIAPADGDIYKIDPQVSRTTQAIKFSVTAGEGVEEVIFNLDGQCLARKGHPFEYLWQPRKGAHRLEVIGRGRTAQESDCVSFVVF